MHCSKDFGSAARFASGRTWKLDLWWLKNGKTVMGRPSWLRVWEGLEWDCCDLLRGCCCSFVTATRRATLIDSTGHPVADRIFLGEKETYCCLTAILILHTDKTKF